MRTVLPAAADGGYGRCYRRLRTVDTDGATGGCGRRTRTVLPAAADGGHGRCYRRWPRTVPSEWHSRQSRRNVKTPVEIKKPFHTAVGSGRRRVVHPRVHHRCTTGAPHGRVCRENVWCTRRCTTGAPQVHHTAHKCNVAKHEHKQANTQTRSELAGATRESKCNKQK